MEYQLEVTGVLGVEHATVRLQSGQVTEVVGPNASGKTSIATAAQAVLARDINPLGLPATDAKRHYAHDGDADAAAATLAVYDIDGAGTDDPVLVLAGEVTWRPAAQTVIAPPELHPSRPEAVGLTDFRARKSAKERAEALQSALLPPPDQVLAAVRTALEPYLDAKALAGVMETLDDLGWDAAMKVYADRGKVAKRQWGDIAGRMWGSSIAADWRPDDWRADWDSLTVSEAEASVTDARDALAVLHRAQAVTEAEAEAAAAAAERLPGLDADCEAKHAALTEASAAEDTARAALARAESAKAEAGRELEAARHAVRVAEETGENLRLTKGSPCPHCEGLLLVASGAVVIFDADDHAGKVADADAEVDRLREARNAKQEAWDAAEAVRGEAATAAAQARY